MAKSTKTLSGQSQRKFFRELFRADPGVAADAADRLVEACTDEIANIRVRLPLAKRRPVTKTEAASAEAQPASQAASSAPFDPNAFSLIVVLRKDGKEALLAKLKEVGDVGQLREIARAQHVSIDAAIADIDALAGAIVAGTEKRVASRQAAAS